MRDLQWYTVRVETRGERLSSDPEGQADALMDLLVAHHGTVGVGQSGWDATISVEAPGVVDAAHVGHDLLFELAEKAGLPAWPPVRVEAVHEDVFAEELERPTLPDLVSGPETAEILGVSRQRVQQLAARVDFPQPLYRLGVGRLWARSGIEAFAQRWERRVGRPPVAGSDESRPRKKVEPMNAERAAAKRKAMEQAKAR